MQSCAKIIGLPTDWIHKQTAISELQNFNTIPLIAMKVWSWCVEGQSTVTVTALYKLTPLAEVSS